MNKHQDKYIIGYVTIEVKGKHHEQFFQYCAENEIAIWNVIRKKKNICSGTIYVNDLNRVSIIAEELGFEVIIKKPKGIQPGLIRLWERKEILISLGFSIIFLFILTNVAWKINISGVSSEIDRQIVEELKNEGLYGGAWVYNLEDLNDIQHQLLHQIPELLYIGIEKKGTTYHVDAIEKSIEKQKQQPVLQHLIAKKAGVIEKIFVENGISTVNVNDVVKEGDLLVSGLIETDDATASEKEKEEEKKKQTFVAAKGKVYANTWYEYTVTSPLSGSYEKLSGNKYTKYMLQINELTVPLWGFNNPYKNTIKERDSYKLKLLSYTLPIAFVRESHYDMDTVSNMKNKEEAKQNAIKYIVKDLKLKFGSDTEILSYKVLHESEENGKVKFNLYISVLEDIATGKTID